MKAMVLTEAGRPLVLSEVPKPVAGPGQVLLKVEACGVCRTDLHIFDNELNQPSLPLILGHEIVGTVQEIGPGLDDALLGSRMGVPWLGNTCGSCTYCQEGMENLCDTPAFTGYQINGGYAECTVADINYCLPIPAQYDAVAAAPLLCAGLIGYRALVMAGASRHVGLYGFGAAAHIITQVALFQERQVYAFTRNGDLQGQEFARSLGAVWAGGSDQSPPRPLDAAIIFAPAGPLVVQALKGVRKGGVVVCAGIHMSDIPSFPYELLWGERSICSVANLTRQDGLDFFEIAPRARVSTTVTPYPLDQANQALEDLRNGRFEGAAVLTMANE